MEKNSEQTPALPSVLTIKNVVIVLAVCFSPLLLMATPLIFFIGLMVGPIVLLVELCSFKVYLLATQQLHLLKYHLSK